MQQTLAGRQVGEVALDDRGRERRVDRAEVVEGGFEGSFGAGKVVEREQRLAAVVVDDAERLRRLTEQGFCAVEVLQGAPRVVAALKDGADVHLGPGDQVVAAGGAKGGERRLAGGDRLVESTQLAEGLHGSETRQPGFEGLLALDGNPRRLVAGQPSFLKAARVAQGAGPRAPDTRTGGRAAQGIGQIDQVSGGRERAARVVRGEVLGGRGQGDHHLIRGTGAANALLAVGPGHRGQRFEERDVVIARGRHGIRTSEATTLVLAPLKCRS